MNISPDQRHRLAKWWVLQQLRFLFLAGPHEMVVEYNFHKPKNLDEPSIEVQRSLIEQLAMSKDVITIHKKEKNRFTVESGPDFDKTYWKYYELAKNFDVLSAEPVVFDDDEATISLGSKKVQLPPFKKEHLLCEAMFQYKVGESVDTSIIYEAISGDESLWDDKGKRMMKDTVIRINKRLREVINLPALFKMEQGTIKRLR